MKRNEALDRLVHALPVWPQFGRDGVHVVSCSLQESILRATELLDENERSRAAQFVFEPDRHRFVTAHAGLRLLLGHCLNCPPGDVRFGVSSHGKPHLLNPDMDLRFNLSHSENHALVALTVGREVGVDIESERPIDVMEIADRFFAAGETRALQRLPDAERQTAFFRCWTRKEAFVKARGGGLSDSLDRFEVSIADDEGLQLLRSCDDEKGSPARWQIRSVPVGTRHAAAVAAEGHDWVLVRHC